MKKNIFEVAERVEQIMEVKKIISRYNRFMKKRMNEAWKEFVEMEMKR